MPTTCVAVTAILIPPGATAVPATGSDPVAAGPVGFCGAGAGAGAAPGLAARAAGSAGTALAIRSGVQYCAVRAAAVAGTACSTAVDGATAVLAGAASAACDTAAAGKSSRAAAAATPAAKDGRLWRMPNT
ncbi:hypothetical protein ACIGO8_17110 [Streptomyces sp. NPDC053493]|uniref:hypothetical protein n=1 Tax=Streptomyces sp. NPDC053493 TaxID=3365705 RepID=UPI0037D2CDE3